MKLEAGLPKTLVALLSRTEAKTPGVIGEAWSEDNAGRDYWVTLGRGYFDSEAGVHALHEYSVAAIRLRLLKFVRPCSCADCRPISK